MSEKVYTEETRPAEDGQATPETSPSTAAPDSDATEDAEAGQPLREGGAAPTDAAKVDQPVDASIATSNAEGQSCDGATPFKSASDPLADEPICVEPTNSEDAPGSQPSSDDKAWYRHESGRWIVGDPGSQLSFEARPSNKVQARSDLSIDWAEYGLLEYRAATIRGLAHFGDGKPRQDSCSLAFTPDRLWLVGCVADGVSSGSLSHVAADLACEVLSKKLLNELSRHGCAPTEAEDWAAFAFTLDWQGAVDAASDAIRDKAMEEFVKVYRNRGNDAELQRLKENGLPHTSARTLMATTAIGFVVGTNKVADGRVPFALAVAAGDSAALILSDGRWHPITPVKNAGEDIASSEVNPLPREGYVEPLAGFLHPGQALAVITDGVGDPLGSGSGVVGAFLAERWSSPPDPLAFANDLAFYRRTFVDDRTAALIWVRNEPDG